MAAPADRTITTPDLRLTRRFRAPQALVWQAWTDPAHIARWWGPHRFTCPHAEIDLRPGGALRFDMKGPDGHVFPAFGTVESVDPPGHLVFTTRLEHEGLVIAEVRHRLTFVAHDDETVVELHASVLRATDAAAAALAGMREGWSQSLDRMVSLAVTGASDRELVVTRRYHAPIETVWEAWTMPRHLEAWWGPVGFRTTTARFDLSPGGQWAHTMHGPDGTDYPNVITFKEIVPGRRLTYEQSGGRATGEVIHFDATIVFERDEDGTRVTLRLQFASADDRQVVNDEYGAYEGARQTLDRLADLLQVP